MSNQEGHMDEKLRKIEVINRVHIREANDEEGDKYLSDAVYAMEAIDAVLNDINSPIPGMFLDAEN